MTAPARSDRDHTRHVLAPLKIGSITLPNRVVCTAHGTGFGSGTMSPALIDCRVAGARGID